MAKYHRCNECGNSWPNTDSERLSAVIAELESLLRTAKNHGGMDEVNLYTQLLTIAKGETK